MAATGSHRASAAPGQLTGLLRAWNEGDRDAAEKLLPIVYVELRQQAARRVASVSARRPPAPRRAWARLPHYVEERRRLDHLRETSLM